MKSFDEYYKEIHDEELLKIAIEESGEEIANEALTNAQRIKAKATFRKNKSKIKRGREKAKRKLATPDKLLKRAQKAARKEVEKKLLKGKSKSDLSFSARQGLEKKVDKKKGVIKRVAKKLLPSVRKKDRSKLKR